MATTLTRERPSPGAALARLKPGPLLVGYEDAVPRAADDVPLSPRARAQAEVLAAQLSGAPYDVVYTGPQRRTREAAAILGRHLGLRAIVHGGLGELPGGPRAVAGLVRTLRFAEEVRLNPRALIVAHGGTLRFLLLLLGGWRRLPWLWRRRVQSEPLVCACQAPVLGFAAPFCLLLAGLALALLAAPGPWPGWATFASLGLALLAYRGAGHLARQGHTGRIVGLLAAVSVLAVPLAFGPDPVAHRKVTAINAWAYEVGAHLPPILVPAPNPNAVAGALAVALALTAAYALYGRGRHRYLAVATAALTAAALVLTASRTGWCAGAAGLFVVAAGRGRRYATVVLALSGLAIAALLGTSPALGSTIDLAIRHSLWQGTVDLVGRQPLTGLGIGRLEQAGIIVSGPFGRAPLNTTHNALLQLWADGGVLGLVAVAWGLLRLGRSMLAPASARPGVPTWASAGLYGALVAFLVQGLFETNTIAIWQAAGGLHHLISPLPFVLLGLLSRAARGRLGCGHHARTPPEGPAPAECEACGPDSPTGGNPPHHLQADGFFLLQPDAVV